MLNSNDEKRLKVLHVRSTIGMYGAEQVILNILPTMNKICDVELVTLEDLTPGSESLRNHVDEISIKSHYFKPNGRLDRSIIKSIKSLIITNGFDIIHSHDYKSLFYIHKAAQELGVKIVHHIHGALGNSLLEKIYGFIECYLMKKVSLIFTVSSEQKNNLISSFFNYPEIIKISNGTVLKDNSSADIASSNTVKLIMVARFTEEKNHILAVDLIERIKSENIPISLALLGDGPLKISIEDNVRARSLQKEIEFVGFTRDVEYWMDKSDVLLITSSTEGMPMNMLEAMANSLPVVSTAVGEITQIIESSGCGKTYSDLEQLVIIMREIHQSRSRWKALGLSGRSYIKNNLSVGMQVDKIIAEYNILMSSNHG